MAKQTRREIYITCNGKSADDMIRTLTNHAAQLDAQIKKLIADGKGSTKECKELVSVSGQLHKQLKQNISSTEMIDKVMKNLAGSTTAQLRKALQAVNREISRSSEESGKLPQLRKQYEALKAQIDKNTGAIHKQGGAWQTAMKILTAYVGMFAVFNQVKSIMTGVIKKNLEYSGSLTDIRKVAGLAQEDINELSKELAKIDTRTSVDGLAQLAYQGAKLGMSKYGVEGMAQFVKAADQINVAIGEEMGEEALPALSKMVEVMGLIPRMGIEKAMLATGSAMFKLSTTSTSTSNDIVEFAKRLTGVARTAGITTDQLLALGSASSSMMLMPEVASTALGKFIVALQKNHNLIAKELGIPDETIKNLYASGHAMDAIVLVLEKMKQKGNMNALGDIFKDLGSDGQRLVTAMVTMSKNVDMLKDHLDTANDAFHEATAVTAEYEMQQESAIGILERANNLWEKAFVNSDGVDNVKELSKSWYEMSKFLTENVFALNSMKAVLWLVITACKTLVYILPALMAGLLFRGAVAAIIGIKTALGGMKDMAILATLRTEGLRAAWAKLNITMKANWISLLIGLLVELGVALTHVFNRQKDVAEGQLDINKYVREGAAEYDRERRKIDSYIAALNNANTSAKQRERIIKNFNREYKPYLDKLGLEVNSVDTLKKAYSRLNAELRKKMFYQIKQKAYDTELGKSEGDVGKAIMDYSKYINSDKGSTWAAYDTKYIQDLVSKGKGAQDIYRSMVESVYGKSGIWSGYDGAYVLQTGSVKDDRLLGYIKNIVSSQEKYNETKKTIDDALDGLIGDYDPYAVETPGTLENDAEDKDAKRKEKQEKRERERAWREELKQKQDEANAIMDNVRNFYERQINAKMQQAISLGMNKSEQDLFVEPMKRRMNDALEQVRLAIAGQANIWEQFKLTMKDDLIEQTDETGINLSEGLLQGITSNNIDALREKLSQLGESLNRPLNSILAEVFAKATKNAQANLKLETQQQEARRKAIQEHDYTGIVQQSSYDIFNTMGYANPTEAEVEDKAAFDKRMDNIIAMFEKARTDISKVFGYDMSNEEDRGLLMQLLFGDDPDGMGERIAQTLGNDAGEWQAFYQKLIQYNDEYESASKKRDDERKKLNDYGWSKTDFSKVYNMLQPKLEQDVAVNGSYRNVGQRMGMESVSASDPELELLKARMTFAQEYYKFLEEHNATEQQLADARRSIMSEQASYAKKLTGDMFEQYNSLLTFMGPLQTFGESVGDAFATMTDNASEGRKQLRSALKQMIKSFATSSLQMISQQQIDRAQTTAHYAQLLVMQQAFGTAKVTGEAATGSALIATKTVNNMTEEQLELAHQTAMAALRSAGIFGWCVSTLGPIAGPIAFSAMMATLMGLISFAVSKIGGRDKSTNDSAKANNIKVTSGMLTYDYGNVQGLRPFVSNDGVLYWATEDNGPHRGVSLLTHPTATTINGQPSLVAENGPEIVIGRETTRAMQMNNPQLLRALVNFDRNFSGRKAYDAGNLSEVATADPTGASVQELIANSAMANMALQEAVTTLLKRLDTPIEAKINMYGYGQLYESMKKAERFMRNK